MMELIWISAAFFSGLIANRLYLPPLVGYLAAGYAMHCLNIAPLQNLNHLADIGIELLLFSVGLKLKAKTQLANPSRSLKCWWFAFIADGSWRCLVFSLARSTCHRRLGIGD
jgi:predicted Kef-type K+ transport protein